MLIKEQQLACKHYRSREGLPYSVCSFVELLAPSQYMNPYSEDPSGKIMDAVELSIAKREALWVSIIARRYMLGRADLWARRLCWEDEENEGHISLLHRMVT